MWLDLQPWLPLLTISLTITLCFLAGIALGLRYKVLILVPAVTLAMIFAMIIGVAHADHFWSIVLAMVVLGTAVQFGYLAGIAIRAAVGSVIPLPHVQAAQRRARQEAAGAIGQGQAGQQASMRPCAHFKSSGWASIKPETSCHPSAPRPLGAAAAMPSRLRWLSSGSPRLPHTCDE